MTAAGQIQNFFWLVFDLRVATVVRENYYAIGIADVEAVTKQCHAKCQV